MHIFYLNFFPSQVESIAHEEHNVQIYIDIDTDFSLLNKLLNVVDLREHTSPDESGHIITV